MFSEKFSLKKTFAESYNPLCVGNPGPPKLYGTRKVVQLTGDIDRGAIRRRRRAASLR